MGAFLVERRIEGLDRLQVAAVQRCLLLSSRGTEVRYLRTTWLPAERRCLCLFEAPGPESVRQVNDTAQVPFTWILPAIDLDAGRIEAR
ncbi:MAG: hypothetical protein AVDCRST_MAG38-321 [uncultured Solirubrobacteraceae bacterium]|uniref:DUF4242 domain-containing protein n=1 Tax=uncultured Solirubrobacteraceae bacterium TaxID=1162706 RepID=A0A6J4R373_9ACTN|nr:MAG: hypothetical protein AVDCRST_MAG38-321 [uncultured Solirubrobacteraceae bacterium]